jgi:hypothetical protein
MNRSTPRYRRGAAVVAVAASAATLVGTGCSVADPSTRRPTPHAASAAQTGSPSGRTAGHRLTVSPTGLPAPATAAVALRRQPATAIVPAPSRATTTAIGTARAWAIAANSSSYRDSSPGQWTVRARPFVTGREARAEAAQRTGGGGVTWAQIQNERCATRVRDLAAYTPRDAPSGPATHLVYVSARVALNCATGTDYLSTFVAQLIVQRVARRWRVALVRH